MLKRRIIEHDIAIDDIEQYGRRMNIRLEGISFQEGETNDDLETKVVTELAKVGVSIETRDIIRLHRSSKAKQKNGSTTRQCIMKLANWRAQERFAGFNKKARQMESTEEVKCIRVNNDLTKRRLTLLDSARNQISSHLSKTFSEDELKHLSDSQNVFAYSNINSELRMRVRGKVIKFNTLPELAAAMLDAFPTDH